MGAAAPVGALLSAGAVLALDRVRWLPVLLAVELILGLWGYNRMTLSTEAMQSPETVAALPVGWDRVGIVDRVQPTALDQELMSASMATLYGANEVIVLSHCACQDTRSCWQRLAWMWGMDHGPSKAEDAQTGKVLVDLLGVRRIFTVHQLGQPYVPVMQTQSGVRVYDNPQAFPRAWFVDCAAGAPLVALDLRRQVQLGHLKEGATEGNVSEAKPLWSSSSSPKDTSAWRWMHPARDGWCSPDPVPRLDCVTGRTERHSGTRQPGHAGLGDLARGAELECRL